MKYCVDCDNMRLSLQGSFNCKVGSKLSLVTGTERPIYKYCETERTELGGCKEEAIRFVPKQGD